VRVTNVTDSAFTVSWVTDSPMPGIVYYGEKDSFLPGPLAWLGKRKAVDDRDFSDAQRECVSKFNENASKNKDENFTVDVSGFDCNDIKVWKYGKYYTHHVTVQNLDAEKEYFFRVGEGVISYSKGKTEGVVYVEREIPEVESFKQKTLPVITKVEAPNPAYGTSYNVYYREDGTMGEKKNFDSLIFLKAFKDGVEYPPLSSVTNMDGGWAIDLANVRKEDGSIVPMQGTSLEFIPQVENTKPGAAGSSFFDEMVFPLNLLGNSEEDWGEKKEVVNSARLKFIGNVSAARICYKCEGGQLKSKTIGDKVACPSGYTLSRPSSCSTTSTTTKTCCKISNNSCACASRPSCGGEYPYSGLDACREKLSPAPLQYINKNWGEPCVNTSTKCKCPDGTIINIGSSCKSTQSIGWGEKCEVSKCTCPDTKTIYTGGYCSEEPISRCSDIKNMIIGSTPVRGGCENGNNYCYIPYYHKNPNGTQGELCTYVKTTGASCGSIYCGDEKVLEIGDKWAGGGKANCTNGSGCRCLDGSIATLNTTCEGKEKKVDCYMYSNTKGCYLAFTTSADTCKSQGGIAGEKACNENFTCTEPGSGVLKDFINICTYRNGCSCPQGAKLASISCGGKCVREEIKDVVATTCALFNTDSQQCQLISSENECRDIKGYNPGNYYLDLSQCNVKHPEAETNVTDDRKCYDSTNFSLIKCSYCGGNCIIGDTALQKKLEEKEKKGFVFVPIKFANSVVQVYIKNDDYQDWLSGCIAGKNPAVEYAYISAPDVFYSGIPSCPKVEFEYIPGKELGDKAMYNYDTLNQIWEFLGLGTMSVAVAELIAGAGGGAATATTAATAATAATVGQIATAMGATGVTAAVEVSATSILTEAMVSAGATASGGLMKGLIAKVASTMAGPGGIQAAKTIAMQIASTLAANAEVAAGVSSVATAAGGTVPLLTAGGTSTTALATVGTGTALTTVSTGTALTTTGGTVATGAATAAGGISLGTVALGVVGVAIVGLGIDAVAHLENVYEQCATVVDGVVTYSIQQKYCQKVRTGAEWKSIPCECNGVRTEMKKSTTPVFDINYYLNSNGTFEACAGSSCNSSGTKLNLSSKSAIEVNGKELICCKDGSQKTIGECCPGLGQYLAQQSCLSPWGKCIKVDKVSVSGFLPSDLQKKELANLKEKFSNSINSVESGKQFSFGKLLKEVHAEGENEQKFLYSDSGLYEVSFVGGADSYLIKEGDTSLYYYLERNGITGYQTPENPFEPKDYEDLAITESSVIISAERQTSLQTVNLKKGINIISFNYVPTLGENGGTLTSDSFLKISNSGGKNNISSISFFAGGQWNGGNTFDFEKRETKGVPFDLVVGKGYVVVANQDCTVYVPSYELTSSVPIPFSSGWNLVGVHGQNEAYTAKTFIESINTIEGLKANNVSWWPTSRGMYQGYQLQNGQEYGQDFPISPLNGYFVRIAEFTPKEDTCKSIIWNPSGEMNGECGSNN